MILMMFSDFMIDTLIYSVLQFPLEDTGWVSAESVCLFSIFSDLICV